jgi:hypothetical protein
MAGILQVTVLVTTTFAASPPVIGMLTMSDDLAAAAMSAAITLPIACIIILIGDTAEDFPALYIL